MNEKQVEILNQVAQHSKDPEMLLKILQAIVHGITTEAQESRKHAIDMEVIASMAVNTKLFRGNESFIADKIEKWKHRNGLRWDDQIKELRKNK